MHPTQQLVFLAISAVLISSCLAANPISIPIIQGGLDVHTRRFAQIPKENGRIAKVVCIIRRGSNLWVCALRQLYQVTPTGSVSVILNVAQAVQAATGRNLNVDNMIHGGLRSVAPHPRFRRNSLLYTSIMEDRPARADRSRYISDVNDPIGADSVLVEWKFNNATGRVDPRSYREVFRVGMPVFDHPIKQLAFNKGLLYIAHGDGSVQSATAGGGQRNDALGKILRINPLRRGSRPYAIPRTNPFRNGGRFPPEVYATGFRNPHHICFGGDGTLYAAETGRSNVEEVNIVKSGANYGWSRREGTFVHRDKGVVIGVGPLPANDARLGYEYPVAQVGHEGDVGAEFIGQAIAGGCPVENGSPMSGNYFYADFPVTGNLYYSRVAEMKSAVTKGNPRALTQARTRQARIFFDHDNNPNTPPRRFNSLGDVIRSERRSQNKRRADVRFGRGKGGVLYWSSKTNGQIYVFTSSQRGGPGGAP